MNAALGAVILARLTDAGHSVDSAAAAVGVSPSTLRRRLSGASPLLITEFAGLADFLGVSMLTLLRVAESAGVSA